MIVQIIVKPFLVVSFIILTSVGTTFAFSDSKSTNETELDSLNPASDLLEWEYVSVKNFKNNEEISLNGQFIVDGQSEIKWAQKEGEEIVIFKITGITGTWDDAQKPGMISYGIARDQSNGILTITRTITGVQIEFRMTNPNRPETSFLFYVNSLKKLTR